MARKYQQYVDPSWQSINVQVMEWVVKTKFEQHPILAKRLLETGDKKLVEHTEVDRFWGDGGDGSGRNMLGEVLMRVRKQLRDSQSHQSHPNYNNGENNQSGGIEANSIYSISGPASSSASSLQALHMYTGNGNIHRINNRNTEKSQPPLPPIPQKSQEQPSPPPLPPRRAEKRDIVRIQE